MIFVSCFLIVWLVERRYCLVVEREVVLALVALVVRVALWAAWADRCRLLADAAAVPPD